MYFALLAVVAISITLIVQSKPTPEPNPQNINLDSLPYESLSFPFEIDSSQNLAEVPAGTPCYPEEGGRAGKKRQLSDPCDKQPEKNNPNVGTQQLQNDPTNNKLPGTVQNPPLIDPQKLKLPNLLEDIPLPGTVQNPPLKDPQKLKLPNLLEDMPLFGGATASGCKSGLIAVCGPTEDDDEPIPFSGKTLYGVDEWNFQTGCPDPENPQIYCCAGMSGKDGYFCTALET